MTKYVTLYHLTDYDGKINYLDPDYCLECAGGQKEGIYFWTSQQIYKKKREETVDAILEGKNVYGSIMEYGPYVTSVPLSTIRYPDWRFDVTLSPEIIDDLAVGLRNYYTKDSSTPSDVTLQLPSHVASWNEYWKGYQRTPCVENVTIQTLSFKDGKTIVKYVDKNNKEAQVQLSKMMYSGDRGIAETLIEFLCQKDRSFRRCYNKRLKQAFSSGGTAIKFVNTKFCIPAIMRGQKKDIRDLPTPPKPVLPNCSFSRIRYEKTPGMRIVQFSLILIGLLSVFPLCNSWREISTRSYKKANNCTVLVINEVKKRITGLTGLFVNCGRTK